MCSLRIVQLSDTHFLEPDTEPEGGYAYDTSAAFDALVGHLGALDPTASEAADLVVVTGDIADDGRPAQYRIAADAFAQLGLPVNACPGNHDFDLPFRVGIGRPTIGTSRVVEAAGWAFIFADSNAGTMEIDANGNAIDPEGETRLHTNGSLGAREADWVGRAIDETEADHVFIWLHHPPGPTVPMCYDAAYAAEWEAVISGRDKVRGFGGGHTHIPTDYTFADRPVFVAPSLKNNFSLEDRTWLPPGYRTYLFGSDGSVSSEVRLIDDERWPRRPFGRALASLFNGDLTFDELREIEARKAVVSEPTAG